MVHGEGVLVPLDYYKILGVSRMSSGSAMLKGYQSAIDSPIEAGYSPSAMQLRAALLLEAYQVLSTPDLKKAYDEAHGGASHVEVDLPLGQIPGALVLLHEVGDVDTVVTLGQSLLDAKLMGPRTSDVALAVALARCDFAARVASQGGPSAPLDAYEELSVALSTLDKYRVRNPTFRAEIAIAMTNMALPYVRAVTSTVPTDDTAGRAHGIKVLGQLAWGTELAPGNPFMMMMPLLSHHPPYRSSPQPCHPHHTSPQPRSPNPNPTPQVFLPPRVSPPVASSWPASLGS